MTISITGATPGRGFRYGNPSLGCERAELSALCRQLATIVTVSGELDESNVSRVTQYAARYVLCEKPFVLDLSEVDACSDRAIAIMYAIDDASYEAGVEWAVVASPAVLDMLAHYGDPAEFHTVDSVPEALHHFADTTARRRRLMSILTKSA
jgi:anti-anti-sigma regulatory factor